MSTKNTTMEELFHKALLGERIGSMLKQFLEARMEHHTLTETERALGSAAELLDQLSTNVICYHVRSTNMQQDELALHCEQCYDTLKSIFEGISTGELNLQ